MIVTKVAKVGRKAARYGGKAVVGKKAKASRTASRTATQARRA